MNRALDLVCGLFLLVTGGFKIIGWLVHGQPSRLFESPTLAQALEHAFDSASSEFISRLVMATITLVEVSIGCFFVAGIRHRIAVCGMFVLGVFFCGWIVLESRIPGIEGLSCGCMGPYELRDVERAMLAAMTLFLAGVQLVLPNRQERRTVSR